MVGKSPGDEAKDWRNKAEDIRAYARQANNRQLEIDAAEIRVCAERRLGELIQAQKKTVGLNRGTAGSGNTNVERGRVTGGPISKARPVGGSLTSLTAHEPSSTVSLDEKGRLFFLYSAGLPQASEVLGKNLSFPDGARWSTCRSPG
jgi:hypothetical protein